jgi:hypothetical protein
LQGFGRCRSKAKDLRYGFARIARTLHFCFDDVQEEGFHLPLAIEGLPVALSPVPKLSAGLAPSKPLRAASRAGSLDRARARGLSAAVGLRRRRGKYDQTKQYRREIRNGQ